jgi:hypothetical protein
MYQGPRAEVLEFFESLGFRLPPRKGFADFLRDVYIMLKMHSFLFTLILVICSILTFKLEN